MRWRVQRKDWQPDQMRYLDREGGKLVDKEQNRRRLSAYELNSVMASRAAWCLLDMAMPDLERQAKHTGNWWRLKGLHVQLNNVLNKMVSKVSLEQVLSIKNNTQNVKICIVPELQDEPEMTIQPLKEHERLLCASLAYCQYHCDGNQLTARKCKIKRLLDDSVYMESCDFPELVPGMCKYNVCDVAWDEIRED